MLNFFLRKEAGVELGGHFIIRKIYEDDHTYNLVTAASKVLELPASAILELFGQFFFEILLLFQSSHFSLFFFVAEIENSAKHILVWNNFK